MNEPKTAHDFTKFVAGILSYDHAQNDDEYDLWEQLKVSDPIINNVIVTLPSGLQYNIQVKKVS